MPSDPPTPGDALIAEFTVPGNVIVARLAKSINVDGDDVVTLANLVECDFEGYEPIPLSDFEDVDTTAADDLEIVSAQLQFVADGILAPQAAVAFYLTATIPADPPTTLEPVTTLAQLEIFEGDVLFEQDGDLFQRQIRAIQSLDA